MGDGSSHGDYGGMVLMMVMMTVMVMVIVACVPSVKTMGVGEDYEIDMFET